MISGVFSVYPNVGVHIYAIELKVYNFVFVAFIDFKSLTIPGCSANSVACSHFTDGSFGKRAHNAVFCLVGQIFNTPVVRQIKQSPGRIIECRIFCFCRVVFYKPPFVVKTDGSGACIFFCAARIAKENKSRDHE